MRYYRAHRLATTATCLLPQTSSAKTTTLLENLPDAWSESHDIELWQEGRQIMVLQPPIHWLPAARWFPSSTDCAGTRARSRDECTGVLEIIVDPFNPVIGSAVGKPEARSDQLFPIIPGHGRCRNAEPIALVRGLRLFSGHEDTKTKRHAPVGQQGHRSNQLWASGGGFREVGRSGAPDSGVF